MPIAHPGSTNTASLQARLQAALAHHQAGRIEPAQSLYAQILLLAPRHAEVLRLHALTLAAQNKLPEATAQLHAALAVQPHFPEAHYSLGNLLQAQHQFPAAIDAYRSALRQNPRLTEAHNNLGNAHAALAQWEPAASAYREALRLLPSYPEALNNLANALRHLGRPADSLATAQRALSIRPNYADAHNSIGLAHAALGQPASARAAFEAALHHSPHFPEALCNLGQLLVREKQPEPAAQHFLAALQQNPTYPEALLGLGNALLALARHDEARAAYEQALALRPAYTEARANLGNVFQKQRRFPEAIAAYEAALALDPQNPELHNNLGTALQSAKKIPAALDAFHRALALRPDYPEALNNLSLALKHQNKFPEAEAALRRALALQPDYAEAHNNLANLYLSLCRGPEALTHYARAAELDPAHPTIPFNRGAALLLCGELSAGWPLYENRFATWLPHERRHTHVPQWRGDFPLRGRTILLHAEQGLGDTLQFIRYAPQVAALGATVRLEVQPAIAPLLKNFPGVASLHLQHEQLPAFDCHCRLLSLPLAFQTTVETIPAATPYLSVPLTPHTSLLPPRRAASTRRVGLVWQGNPNHENDHNRSLPFAQLRTLLDAQPELEFISLQKPECAEFVAYARERSANASLIPLISNLPLNSFADTATVIAELDLVIAVDTSVAHLAGAMGKPVWLLLPFSPDWRWLLGRTDSPWYPSMRLFRQSAVGDWSAPLREITEALKRLP